MHYLNPLKRTKIELNLHFWIIVFTTLAITFIYYRWFEMYVWFWWFAIYESQYNIVGSLYFAPIIHASLVYWWRGSLIVWLLSVIAIMPQMVRLSYKSADLIVNILMLTIPLMVVMIITLNLVWREKQRLLLVEREAERQHYMSQILKAQEDERHRIAQELHDDTIPDLLVIANRAQEIISDGDSIDNKTLNGKMEWIRETTLDITKKLRRLSLDLRPSVLDNLGLVAALRWLMKRFNRYSEIQAEIVVRGTPVKLNPEVEVTIFRIVQETLNNVHKHSKAKKVFVTLKYNPESLVILVHDDGIGFSQSKRLGSLATENKIGIFGMEQRAQSINGSVSINSKPGEGTSVLIEIPFSTVTGIITDNVNKMHL